MKGEAILVNHDDWHEHWPECRHQTDHVLQRGATEKFERIGGKK